MQPAEAARLITREILTPPGVTVSARVHDRYENAIVIAVRMRPRDSRFPPEYQARAPRPVEAYEPVLVDEYETVDDLALLVIDVLEDVASHEIREKVRIKDDLRAPAHPHKSEGIRRYADAHDTDPAKDLRFGIA